MHPRFQPPQKARTGGTGLYCGEQDLFAFLIDPTGWAEIVTDGVAPEKAAEKALKRVAEIFAKYPIA